MRALIDEFGRSFDEIDEGSRIILRKTPNDVLFRDTAANGLPYLNVGSCILRSAASVEQTFGGITTRLWDDPFEWTLPEKLSTTTLIEEYLDEVAETRRAGLGFLQSDDDLKRELPAPEKLISIFSLLLATAGRAEHYLGRAAAAFQAITGEKLRRR